MGSANDEMFSINRDELIRENCRKRKTMKTTLTFCLIFVVFTAVGCSIAPEKPEAKAFLASQVQETIALFKARDPTIERFFNESYGFVVFPKVFKAAFIGGGAFGRGEVYEQDKMVGYSSMSQATVGFSVGGEYFREIIFLRDKADLDKFKVEELVFAAQVTGVALSSGAAAKADYKAGMAVFIMEDKGLMVDASLGGQTFKYISANP
jgi:lipid-binding SYLF domain-containing protein